MRTEWNTTVPGLYRWY